MNKVKKSVIFTIIFAILVLLTTTSLADVNLIVNDIDVAVNGTEAKLEWSKASGATGYEVYVDLPAIGYQCVGKVTGNKVTILGFDEGEIYAVKVRAYNENGVSSTYSSEIKFITGENAQTTSKLGEVSNIKAISEGTTGTISWEGVKDASGYEIYASVKNSEYIDIGSTTSTKVKLIGMDEDEVYSIKIQPYLKQNDKKVYGSLSNLAILKYEEENVEYKKPDKVTNLQKTINNKNVVLTWNSVNNVDGYQIIVQTPGKGNAEFYSSTNKISLEGFTAGCTYTAKVRAYEYINGEKQYGDPSTSINIKIEEEKEKTKLDKVTGLKVKMNGSQATFSWNSVSKAEGYELSICIPGTGPSDTIVTTTGTSKTITGFTNKDYNYSAKVRAYATENGKTIYSEEYSDIVYFKNNEIVEDEEENSNINQNQSPKLSVKMDGDIARFTWNKISEATAYELVVKDPQKGETTYNMSTTYANVTGIRNTSSNYTAKVVGYKVVNGKKVYGSYSNTVYFKNTETESNSKLAQVTGLSVSRNGTKATMSWNKVSGADGYEMILEIPGYGKSYKNVTGTSIKMSGFTTTAYKYTVKVRAYKVENGRKVYGAYSTIKEF